MLAHSYAARPAFTRSRMISRSSSANALAMWNMARRIGVPVSIASSSDANSIPDYPKTFTYRIGPWSPRLLR
jgi:hypothetical protein